MQHTAQAARDGLMSHVPTGRTQGMTSREVLVHIEEVGHGDHVALGLGRHLLCLVLPDGSCTRCQQGRLKRHTYIKPGTWSYARQRGGTAVIYGAAQHACPCGCNTRGLAKPIASEHSRGQTDLFEISALLETAFLVEGIFLLFLQLLAVGRLSLFFGLLDLLADPGELLFDIGDKEVKLLLHGDSPRHDGVALEPPAPEVVEVSKVVDNPAHRQGRGQQHGDRQADILSRLPRTQ
jgi:hypothetical protein